ncbi:MAG: ABC transporter substrate-binding protein [Hyphomicrobiaceae bacterium]|nr:ABC transporter substrate-binding protein [Hyphomicrobiaceae bacterium]
MNTRIVATLAMMALLPWPSLAQAQSKFSDSVVKLGVLTDMSGPYSDNNGPGSVLAAQMAIDDFGGKVRGLPIELVYADNLNKPDVGVNIARRWLDVEQVDALVDIASSGVALAVGDVAAERNKIILNSGSSTTRITNEQCNKVTAHWTYDTYALGKSTASEITRRGGDSWFFITADYVFGHSLEKDARTFIEASGGKILGGIKAPFPTNDFSSFVLRAQESGAKVVVFANSGADLVNGMKAAGEFGLTSKQQVTGLLVMINDIHAMGLKAAKGMLVTEAFYWNMNDKARAWSMRFFEKRKRMPTMIQAGIYSMVTHYLKAIEAVGTDEAQAVMAQMRATPVNDFFATNGRLREDGKMVHDMYLFQVKSPEESKEPWDYYKLVATIPADRAFQPLSESRCPFIKKQ